MNSNCFTDVLAGLFDDSTSFQSWTGDVSGYSNHIYKYTVNAASDISSSTDYPFISLAPFVQSVDFISDSNFRWSTDITVQFIDIVSNYDSDEEAEILYAFQSNVDSILQDIVALPAIKGTGLLRLQAIEGPLIDDEIYANQNYGRELLSIYSFSFSG